MDTHLDMLNHAVADVLERFAFMFADPVAQDETPGITEDFHQASISFNGPQLGSITLAASGAFCTQLAANVLGLDLGNITPEAGDDALKELLNVITGEYLETMAGRDAIFNLSIPSITQHPAGEWARLIESSSWQGLMADEWPLLIKLNEGA